MKKVVKLPQLNKSKILAISLALLFSLVLVLVVSLDGRIGKGNIFTSDFLGLYSAGNQTIRAQQINPNLPGFPYYKKISIINSSGTTLINEDVLITVDTQTLIAQGKMQSDCDDIRLYDGTDLLTFWIEGQCNTTATQIWVRIPSLPAGETIIYMHYGNSSASSGSLSWSGDVVLFADATCPTGWTRVSAMDNKFLYGSDTYGQTGGTSSHAHNDAIGTSTSIYYTGISSLSTTTTAGANRTHTHTSLKATIQTNSSVLPPYVEMVMCSKDSFSFNSGLISMFDSAAPTGWTRFSNLDDSFPRAASSYGASGGSTTHTHTTGTGFLTSTPTGTTNIRTSLTGSTSFATGTHTHTSTSATVSLGTNVPPYQNFVFAKADSDTYVTSNNILIVSALPPLGWNRYSQLDNRFPRGATSYGTLGGTATHTHSVTITTGGASQSLIPISGTTASWVDSDHYHSTTVTTNAVSNIPPYYSVIYTKRKTSVQATIVSTLPSAPLNLISRYGVEEVKLYWQYPADDGGGITDYIVQYSNNGGSTWTTFNDGVSTNLYTTVTGLTNGHQYQFRVAGINPAGTGSYSNITTSTPQALTITSITPTSGTYLGGGTMEIEGTGFGDDPVFSQISAGYSHTCGLSDGNGYCWGNNSGGQLGTGDTTNFTTPKLVLQGDMGAGVTFTSITAGQNHTCGLGSDGNGYCWGNNQYGKLGTGDTDYYYTPKLVSQGDRSTGVTFTSISAGNQHTCGLGSDGNAYCWGYNQYGRLGTNDTTNFTTPKEVVQGDRGAGVPFTSITVGNTYTCGLGSDGNGYCWGYNGNGGLGTGNTTQYTYPKKVVQGDRVTGVPFTSITVGDNHTCGLGSDGNGYCWGYNSYGRLGTGDTTQYTSPKLVLQGERGAGVIFTSISAGNAYTCGLGSDSNGYCWGSNSGGQLGVGTSDYNAHSVPELVLQGDRAAGVIFTSISAGQSHICGLGSDSNGYCWGVNNFGQLGVGTSDYDAHSTPAIVGGTVFNINFGDLLYQNVAVAVGDTSIVISAIPSYAIGTINISITRTSDNVTSNTLTYTYTNLPSPDITSITPSITGKGGGESLSISGTGFLGYGPMKLASISAGPSHTCGLDSDGNGYCWGYNEYGQLGVGTSDEDVHSVPELVLQGERGAGITFTSISAGQSHICGVGSDGNGYCWGRNTYYQLGTGDTTNSNIPKLVLQGDRGAGVTFTSISAGSSHACGIGSDGNGYCWGYNGSGQLGTGDTSSYNIPKLVLQGDRVAGVTFTSISAGDYHACGIGSDGNGYCWGYNEYGQLGTGDTADSNTPKLVLQGDRGAGVTFTSISAGSSHTCGLGSDGNGYCWGYNYYGQLGVGTSDEDVHSVPELVLQGDRGAGITFTSISAGQSHICGVGSDGNGYCWGNNESGQLGTNDTTNYNTPKLVFDAAVPSSGTLTSISAGGYHTCGMDSDGSGYCWGYNGSGQLSTNDTIDRLTMTYILRMGHSSYVPANLSVTAITPGGCGLGSDGNGYCWGHNSYGQLGTGDTTNYNTPKLVLQGDRGAGVTFTSISAGSSHTCGLGSDGNGYCWGNNESGQLGVGTSDYNAHSVPELVLQGERVAGVTFISISVRGGHTCGLGSDGNGYCWGDNYNGELGTGNAGVSYNIPKLVLQGDRGAGVIFTSISVGHQHTCGVGSDGNGYCWGYNYYGRLGTGNSTQYTSPKLVLQGDRVAGVTFTSISAGGSYTCGLGSDGNGYCWGWNYYGQLGTGNTTNYYTPKLVLQGDRGAGVTFTSISAGYYHTCGLGSDGNGYCWGYNEYGELGIGTFDSNAHSIPELVLQGDRGAGVTFTSISAGSSHTCGIGSDGNGYCWGYNSNGQLGTGDTTNYNTPKAALQEVLIPAIKIEFGTILAPNTVYNSSTSMNATTPVFSSYGTVTVKLTNPDGQYDTYDIYVGSLPSAPLNLISRYGVEEVKLYWQYPADDGGSITDYIIQYSNNGGSTWTTFNDGVSTNLYTTVTGLTNGHQYQFRVAAKNLVGTSGYSNVTTSTPRGLAITSITPSSGLYFGGGTMEIEGTGFGDYPVFSQISAGYQHTCGLDSDGNGYCWGYGSRGQLGNGSTIQKTTPVLVSQGARPSGVTFTSISAGYEHTCGLGSDGNGYCWGYNDDGQLGIGTFDYNAHSVPGLVLQGDRGVGVTFTSISVGNEHTCGVGSDGNGYCWGYNQYGRLGTGDTTKYNTPKLVLQGDRGAGVTFASITPGNYHTCGLGSDGNGYCWGYNSNGQLGTGDTTQYPSPKKVVQGERGVGVTFTSISAGSDSSGYTCGLGSDGNGYCWGNNIFGRLGTVSSTNSNTPKKVAQGDRGAGVTFTSIRAGQYHTCGIDSDGNGYCWGRNSNGQLGTGNSTNSNTPKKVVQGERDTGVTFASISTGSNYSGHTCGVGSDGNGYCWGYNSSGQLGIGTSDSDVHSTPAIVGGTLFNINFGDLAYNGIIGRDTSIVISPIPSYAIGTINISITRTSDNLTSNTLTYTYTNLPSPDITNITPSITGKGGGEGLAISGTDFLDYGPMKLISIAAGSGHTCGLGSDGNGYCWGDGHYGQLGTGNSTNSNTPKLVLQGDRGVGVTFTSISAGSGYNGHTCGLGSDGNGYCWGYNSSGQLGTGNTTQYAYPKLVLQGDRVAGVTFTSISAGHQHTCGLGSDGNGYCWGYNYYGGLGTGDTTQYPSPKLVLQGDRGAGVTFTSISAGSGSSDHTCGLGSDGNGYCWGYNGNGQLGTGNTAQYTSPKKVLQGDRGAGVTFTSISVGDVHTCGLGSDGNGYCWGANGSGQLGTGNTAQYTSPKKVLQGDRGAGVTFTSISAGQNHTCGIGSDGNGYCWGYNSYGQLGTGDTTNSNTPKLVFDVAISSSGTLESISAGQYHTCGVGSDGNGYCWGYNYSGQLGTNDTIGRLTMTYIFRMGHSSYVPAGVTFTSIRAGQYHTCGIDSDGNGYCWGSNGYGQLGDGTTTISSIPILVSQGVIPSGVTFTSISAGYTHTCGLGSDGNGYCWGYNYYGQLGTGDTTNSNTPKKVLQGDRGVGVTFTSISAGNGYTCGIGSDDKAYCWGYNYYGQLGTGDTTNYNTPKLVLQGDRGAGVTFTSISVGNSHTCGVGSDGNGYCWGYNQYGRLGIGNTTNYNTPKLVLQGDRGAGATFTSISAGQNHTCGIGSDGNGYCWGYNSYGQLGTGDTTNSNTPKLVLQGDRGAGVTFTSISVGDVHTCGVGSDGNGYCWGYSGYGRLGTGDTTNNNTPKLVLQGDRVAGVTFSSISAGYEHTCGLGSDGNGYCWGYNYSGQLGVGTLDDYEWGTHPIPELFSALQEVFIPAIKIEFGSILAASTTYNSSTSMNATTPVFSSYGIVIVKLTNPDGQYDTYEILVADPPTAPLNLSAIAGNTKVTLSWDAPSDNGGQTITDYLIQYSSDGGSTWATLSHTPSTNTVAVITNLTNNTEYIFRVAAINTIGTGPYSTITSATPFNANPTFTAISNTSPANPGGSITWNATASDDMGVRLLVCKTASITNGVCSGGAWCTSSTVSSNPSCTYNVPDPSPAGIFNAYVYVLDAENLQAPLPLQGSNSPFTISGVAPMINTVIINEGSAIVLIGASTKDIEVTATVTSQNSCQSIDTVKAYLYRSGIGYSNCNESEDSNANNCYAEITCVQDSGSGACTDATDSSANYTCSVDMEYYSDPTDVNTEFSAQNWLATVKATDINTLSATQEITTGVELSSLISFSIVESSLTYGTLLAGFSNPTLSETITSIPTGNVGLDQKHSGDSKGMCANYPTCTAPSAIPLTNQRYSITSNTLFEDGTQLSSTPAVVDINIPKMRGTTPSKLSYWGIYVPLGTLPGGYEGKNFIDAVKGEVSNW